MSAHSYKITLDKPTGTGSEWARFHSDTYGFKLIKAEGQSLWVEPKRPESFEEALVEDGVSFVQEINYESPVWTLAVDINAALDDLGVPVSEGRVFPANRTYCSLDSLDLWQRGQMVFPEIVKIVGDVFKSDASIGRVDRTWKLHATAVDRVSKYILHLHEERAAREFGLSQQKRVCKILRGMESLKPYCYDTEFSILGTDCRVVVSHDKLSVSSRDMHFYGVILHHRPKDFDAVIESAVEKVVAHVREFVRARDAATDAIKAMDEDKKEWK
jgi:hypothetical protein